MLQLSRPKEVVLTRKILKVRMGIEWALEWERKEKRNGYHKSSRKIKNK